LKKYTTFFIRKKKKYSLFSIFLSFKKKKKKKKLTLCVAGQPDTDVVGGSTTTPGAFGGWPESQGWS
jgi:hypothetical protein